MDKKTYVVYKHTNTVNDKAYIGFSGLTIIERYGLHLSDMRCGSMLAFHCALRKHGESVWTHEVLERHETKHAATTAEVRLIAEHKTWAPYGYNETHGGEGGELVGAALERYYAAVRSPEMRAKRSINAKRSFEDPEIRRRHREAINRPEAKAKQSQSLKVTNARSEVKQRRSVAQLTAQNRPDVKLRKSASLKQANQRDDVRAKRSSASREVGTRPDVKHRKAIKLSKPIEQLLFPSFEHIARFSSVTEAANVTGIHYSNISSCALGNRSHAGGFAWRYVT
jgi:group I intron endonuclease